MRVREEVRWHCPNRDCNRTFVGIASGNGDRGPQCVCGRRMNRGSSVSHYLDFLREGAAEEQEVETEKE
jgi:hypothetical protein